MKMAALIGILILIFVAFFGCVKESGTAQSEFNPMLELSQNFTQFYFEGDMNEYSASYNYTKMVDKLNLTPASLDVGFVKEMDSKDIPTVEEFFEQATSLVGVYNKTFSTKRIGKYDVDLVDAILIIRVDPSQISDKTESEEFALRASCRVYYIRRENNLMFVNVLIYDIDKATEVPNDQIYSEVEDAIMRLRI